MLGIAGSACDRSVPAAAVVYVCQNEELHPHAAHKTFRMIKVGNGGVGDERGYLAYHVWIVTFHALTVLFVATLLFYAVFCAHCICPFMSCLSLWVHFFVCI